MSILKDTFAYPSMFSRVGIGKTLGVLYGLFVVYIAIGILPDLSTSFLIGLWFWYILIGAVVGLLGAIRFYLFFTFKWWFRGPMIGAWMNFVLALLMVDFIPEILAKLDLTHGSFIVRLVIEGAVLGLVMDFLATKFGGEGKESVKN